MMRHPAVHEGTGRGSKRPRLQESQGGTSREEDVSLRHTG